MGVSGRVLEFSAYRLMYYLYNEDVGGLSHLLAELTPEMLESPEISHALQVVTAVTTENYHRFFLLYQRTPNMGQYILDHLFERIRFSALKTIAKSFVLAPLVSEPIPVSSLFLLLCILCRFRPEKLPISYLVQELKFDNDGGCVEFIEAHEGVLDSNKTEFNTKESVGAFKHYEDNLEIVK